MHIEAPFTEKEIEALKQWQEGKVTTPWYVGEHIVQVPPHPFTCGTPEGCPHATRLDEQGVFNFRYGSTDLMPTEEGLICPCGQYKQNWVHNYAAGYGDEACQECGRGEMVCTGSSPSGQQSFECNNCYHTENWP